MLMLNDASMLLTIINAIMLSIALGVLGTWIYFLAYALKTYKYAPKLAYGEHNAISISRYPSVDIIVPARNEERFISRCLESLLKQDYSNYRVIAVDDCSTDNTPNIINDYAKRMGNKITFIRLNSKPEGWVGKNWACYNAYTHSNAELLLFTDADSLHDKRLLSLAVSNMLSNDLDALTLVPRLECIDRWSKITVPLLLTFLYSRYSPLRVNSSKHDTGYFFGSYYIIKRSVYESIGTHSSVRNEIIEDGALGARAKKQGFKIRMYLADHLFYAVWSRDLNTLINGLARLIAPIYAVSKAKAIGIVALTFFLFVYPLLSLPYSLLVSSIQLSLYLLYSSIATIIIMIIISMLNTLKGVGIKVNPIHGLCTPLASLIIFYGFLSGIKKSKHGVVWRDRSYSYHNYRADGFKL